MDPVATYFDQSQQMDIVTYMQAHSLLPRAYQSGNYGAWSQADVSWSLSALADSTSSPETILKAIVILGHSPCTAAFEALVKHSGTPLPHAGVATLAANECRGLLQAIRKTAVGQC